MYFFSLKSVHSQLRVLGKTSIVNNDVDDMLNNA